MVGLKRIILCIMMGVTGVGGVSWPPCHRYHHHHHHHRCDYWIVPTVIGSAAIVTQVVQQSQEPKVIIKEPNKKLIKIEILPDGTKVYHYVYEN